mgnify:CR=1 FL=1
MPAECPDYVGFIVCILDIADPSNPVECGRWWMPEQFKDGMNNTFLNALFKSLFIERRSLGLEASLCSIVSHTMERSITSV